MRTHVARRCPHSLIQQSQLALHLLGLVRCLLILLLLALGGVGSGPLEARLPLFFICSVSGLGSEVVLARRRALYRGR